jgi:hypothetical protein
MNKLFSSFSLFTTHALLIGRDASRARDQSWPTSHRGIVRYGAAVMPQKPDKRQSSASSRSPSSYSARRCRLPKRHSELRRDSTHVTAPHTPFSPSNPAIKVPVCCLHHAVVWCISLRFDILFVKQ